MTDYQTLYQQSLLLIEKQKQQIKKLQEQIRQRCQSYLIHSSRYRTKKQNSLTPNQKQNQPSPSLSPNSSQPELQISQNTVNITLQNHQNRDYVIDEQVNTQTREASTQKTSSIPRSQQNTQEGRVINKQVSVQRQLGQNIQIAQLQNLSREELLQRLVSLKSKGSIGSSISEQTAIVSQQKILQRQNTQPQMNWQQVISDWKDRFSRVQKQKSQQVQKVIQLQKQITNYRKQQKNWIQSMASMKKKPNRSIQYNNSQQSPSKNENQDINNVNNSSAKKLDENTQKCMGKLLQELGKQIDFSINNTLQQKIQSVITYVKQLQSKNQNNANNLSVQNSHVQYYNYSTPYKNMKQQSNKNSHIKEYQSNQQVQVLKKRCQQLQAQLKSLSRVQNQEKNQQSQEDNKQSQNQQQIINDPPYLIQQQLEKPQNSPYVKRSFVRKKVVKRNLSAMIMKTPNKTKQQRKASLIKQLQNLKAHLSKSKNGQNDKSVSSITKKIQKLQNSIEGLQPKIEQQIDQISNQSGSLARASGISQDNFTQIIQVETEGPGFKNYTAHILGLNRRDKSVHDKKKKQSPY